MLSDINKMTDSDIYEARLEIAGQLVNLQGLALHYSKDPDTRVRAGELRALAEKVELRLLSVTRP